MTPASAPSATIVALHGFLGLPSDWAPFEFRVHGQDDARPLWLPINVWSYAERLPPDVDAFAWFADELVCALETDGVAKPLLLGYSMGGRLAMNAFVRRPEAFAGAVFVSANPGLPREATVARSERIAADATWATRFAGSEDWIELMQAWNTQPVLASTAGAGGRQEADFNRANLATALSRWSLGLQPDLRGALGAKTLPKSLWLCGERDRKYVDLYRALAPSGEFGDARVRILPEAGHRAPWDQPDLFVAELSRFAADVSRL